jgi:hypothetical protein
MFQQPYDARTPDGMVLQRCGRNQAKTIINILKVSLSNQRLPETLHGLMQHNSITENLHLMEKEETIFTLMDKIPVSCQAMLYSGLIQV